MSGGDYPPPQPDTLEHSLYIGLIKALYHTKLFLDCPVERKLWSNVLQVVKSKWP